MYRVVSDDAAILAKASSDVRRYFKRESEFSAELVLIVTWYQVGYYGATKGGKNKVSHRCFGCIVVRFVIWHIEQLGHTTWTDPIVPEYLCA